MYLFITRLFAFSLMLIMFGGCASKQPYRVQTTSGVCVAANADECKSAAVQQLTPGQEGEYYLGFTEFDDQGQALKREQLSHVVDTFQTIAGQEMAKDKGVILIAFAHGWHHSASNEPQDGCMEDCNIAQFRQLLTTISKLEATTGAKRKVLGLYIGWRGDSITSDLINWATFWDRKNTAHDVGLQGVAEVLVKLEEIANVGNTVVGADPLNKSHLVVLGHSFGGAVVYTALQQIMVDRYTSSQVGKNVSSDAGGFGDLVVLMNPAFEAMRFSTLYDIAQDKCRNYTPYQNPRLMILTSETDWATGKVFPLGRFFSTAFESHEELNRYDCVADSPDAKTYTKKEKVIYECEADTDAVGHFEPFITHRLRSRPDLMQMERQDLASFIELKERWAKQSSQEKLPFQGSELEHLGKTHPRNPYLNIHVDEALMDGHNDIWGKNIVSFVRDFIVTSTLPVKVRKQE